MVAVQQTSESVGSDPLTSLMPALFRVASAVLGDDDQATAILADVAGAGWAEIPPGPGLTRAVWQRTVASALAAPETGSADVGHDDRGARPVLAGLDPMTRAVVVLHEVERVSVEEIAAICEIPVSCVATRLSQARRRLAAVYDL